MFPFTPNIDTAPACQPQPVQCIPRNWWESFSGDFHYQTIQLLNSSIGVLILISLLTLIALRLSTLKSMTERKREFGAIATLSGFSAAILHFAWRGSPSDGLPDAVIFGLGIAAASATILIASAVCWRQAR